MPAKAKFSSRHALHTKRRGFTGDKDVEHDALLEDIAADPRKVADLALTKQIAELLEQYYPAHPWCVSVSHAQGVAMIKLPILMSATQQYVLHIDRINTDNDLVRLVRQAGGELLERFRMPRAGFSLTPFLEARERARPKRIVLPDHAAVVSKLRREAAPQLLVPEFSSSARPKPASAA